MVEKSISYRSFVDISRFWVRDIEGMVAAMRIGLLLKIAVEGEDVVHKMKLEFLDILLLPLTLQKLLPGFENIFDGNDMLIRMTEPLKSPPPDEFFRLLTMH